MIGKAFAWAAPWRARAMGSALIWPALAMGSLAIGIAGGVAANSLAATWFSANPADHARVLQAMRARLPRTAIDTVNCTKLGGLCEVVAGTSLFYVDQSARFLVIGRVYDMETRSDLTAAKLLSLNPDVLAASGARATQDMPAALDTSRPRQVDLASLPASGAIHWGPANGPRLIVLSDFACGYCRQLAVELKKGGIRVEERPISIFGAASRAAAERVLCAPDPASALHLAYRQKTLPAPRACDSAGLDGNESFARRNGFAGTPVIIRPSDGAVLEGYRPAAVLKSFALGGRP